MQSRIKAGTTINRPTTNRRGRCMSTRGTRPSDSRHGRFLQPNAGFLTFGSTERPRLPHWVAEQSRRHRASGQLRRDPEPTNAFGPGAAGGVSPATDRLNV